MWAIEWRRGRPRLGWSGSAMRQIGGRLGLLVVVAVVLLTGATGYVVMGLRLYHVYQRQNGNYLIDPAGACEALITWSPPSDIFTAFYANQPTFITVRYRSPHPQMFRLTLSVPHFTQEQSFDVQAGSTFRSQ